MVDKLGAGFIRLLSYKNKNRNQKKNIKSDVFFSLISTFAFS